MGHILGTKPFTLEQLLDFCEANGHRDGDGGRKRQAAADRHGSRST